MISADTTSLICPPALQKGDTVAIVALASKINSDDLQAAFHVIENDWGLKLIICDSVNTHYYNFAGTDELRQHDFQQMLDNQEVKGIFSARGGYGSSRFIDKIDFTGFKKYPKWVVGFSDITEILTNIQLIGIQALHAPMPKTLMYDAFSRESLRRLLFGEDQFYTLIADPMNRKGNVSSKITGGNLTLLVSSLGTNAEVQTDGKILFIEDIDEYLYSIDRMVLQLKRAHKLQNLAALIVGNFSSIRENDEPFGKTVNEIIAEHIADYHYPVCYNFPVGHEPCNWAIPCGRVVSLHIDNQLVSLKV